jgi:hypothetical protein
VNTTPANDDLFHALAARARATSDGTLALVVIVGLTAVIRGVLGAALGTWIS